MAKKEAFHTCVAKLLYLTQRVRPDVLTAVAFLTTRVNCPDVDDANKLHRLLKYLNATKHLGMRLKPVGEWQSYVDASYAPHRDAKSHSGGVQYWGGTISAYSVKQRITATSTPESELIAVPDNLKQVLWMNEFMKSHGYKKTQAYSNFSR
jgi:hypothetical protein